jgi:Cu/Ag efflux protein CusF
MRELLIVVFLLITGNSAYSLPPLTTDHPARRDAMAASQSPVLRKLVYTPSDVRLTRPAPAVAAPQPTDHGVHHDSQSTVQTVVGAGKVIATVPNSNKIVVEHEAIKGFMDAMTMGYQVDPPTLIKGLKAGDKVHFTIDIKRKTIVKIEKLKD